MPPTGDELLRALQELEAALEAFAAVYEAWARSPDVGPQALVEALARAEQRLDDARAALEAIESRLRA